MFQFRKNANRLLHHFYVFDSILNVEGEVEMDLSLFFSELYQGHFGIGDETDFLDFRVAD